MAGLGGHQFINQGKLPNHWNERDQIWRTCTYSQGNGHRLTKGRGGEGRGGEGRGGEGRGGEGRGGEGRGGRDNCYTYSNGTTIYK